MSLEVIEGRLRALEDVEEIKRLEARYCTYCDNNHYAYQITNLFVEDAIWDGCIRGNAGGRYGIHNFFLDLSKRQPLAVHLVNTPIIGVNGNTAYGIRCLFQACRYTDGDRAVWGLEGTMNSTHEEYVRVTGVWMFKLLKLTPHFWTPFDDGWVKDQFG